MTIPTVVPFDETPNWYDDAVRAYQSSRFNEAQTLVDQILARDAEHAAALHLQGLLALASGHTVVARNWVTRAIEINPEPIFYNTLYAIEFEMGEFVSAVESLRRGLALQPDFPPLHYNLAVALQHHDRLEEAKVSYSRTLELDPHNSLAHNNLGAVFRELGAVAEAEWHYRQAVALAQTNLVARNNLADILLITGRYEEAWPYFEDRWITSRLADGRRHPVRTAVPLRQWKGEGLDPGDQTEKKSAVGERLLILHEQGLGDSLQFVRYMPLALKRFSQVAYVCPPPLRRMYEQSLCPRLPGLVLLEAVPANLEGWDWYCPLLSLMLAFSTRVETVPASIPYLYADVGRAARWGARLAALPGPDLPRVGIVWAGGHSGIAVDARRSLTFAQIAPLFDVSHVRWISLQKTEDPAKCSDVGNESGLTDWMDEVTDFAETAALIENLDLVISVDTSVAHLAAAMGKPVWMLNRFAGCWRWLHGRDDSPWYPSLRLFTQSQRGNWDDVLDRVVAALRDAFSR